jgi:hypothetical protein
MPPLRLHYVGGDWDIYYFLFKRVAIFYCTDSESLIKEGGHSMVLEIFLSAIPKDVQIFLIL